MREIRFRCWYNEKMWYAIPKIQFRESGIHNVHLNNDPDDFCDASDTWTGSDEYHLMQYTGLKDKNGVEIYEGDFIKYRNPWFLREFIVREVKWCPLSLRFSLSKPNFSPGDDFCVGRDAVFDGVIVGNIYEHADLLENNHEPE